jgi:pyruvate ferredoxin oxidoreductase delta subunit
MSELKKYKELALGGNIEKGGTAADFKTGDWKSSRPVYNPENCIQCLFCWVYCPDSAVILKDGKVTGFNLDHCKGCGICAHECPGKKKVKAIIMEEEVK